MENEVSLIGWKIEKVTIWKLLLYFIIYSIFGFILETIFCIFIDGVLESRQSFLYGPFCAIYGLGAVVMTIILYYLNKDNVNSNMKLFIFSMFIGSLIEYLVSFIGEYIFHVKWWDYSNLPLNFGGRITLIYSVIWGILGLFLIKVGNPTIDRVIHIMQNKCTDKTIKVIISTVSILLLIDYLVSSIVLDLFTMRIVAKYDIDVEYKDKYKSRYEQIYSNERVSNIINTLWSDEKMILTFPNNQLRLANGDIIFVKDLMPEIKPYYLRVFNKKNKLEN